MKTHDTLDFVNHHQLLHPQNVLGALSLRVAASRSKLVDWRRRLRNRNELKRLLRIGPYMIKDIGLTLDEAYREIQKPFWTP